MNRNQIIIALGSNENAEQNVFLASNALEVLLPDVYWAEPEFTTPEDCCNSALFFNRVGIAFTYMNIEELTKHFKLIEVSLGRTPERSREGFIPIDIDLLKWNETILKPNDLKRDYVLKGIKQIRNLSE